ncbi:hypothetical protein [Actinomadura sp. 21ATH]|uniref:hypothetical protein n=1 Tax=Actinomadura sp. 21ATH TaxID=1735444 RepID=UPI0035C2405A
MVLVTAVTGPMFRDVSDAVRLGVPLAVLVPVAALASGVRGVAWTVVAAGALHLLVPFGALGRADVVAMARTDTVLLTRVLGLLAAGAAAVVLRPVPDYRACFKVDQSHSLMATMWTVAW